MTAFDAAQAGADLIVRTRIAAGLPPTVEDVRVLDAIATVLHSTRTGWVTPAEPRGDPR